jgi:18S rRNA (guanine1575-N7)-methyltransferase
MLAEEAMKVGFGGGLVVDYPHSTRAKKYYLCLMVGAPHGGAALPPALAAEGEVSVGERQHGGKRRKVAGAGGGRGKSWVFKKKEQMRGKGYVGIAPDSKYTARKRKDRF